MTSPYVLNDVFFNRALSSLPATLLEAMLSAELTDPGVLRLYPRYTSEELGIQRETHFVTSVAGTASAAVLAAKAASSFHEPSLSIPSSVSSLSSSCVCLSVSPADGHPASNAPDLSGSPAQTDTSSSTGLKRVVFPSKRAVLRGFRKKIGFPKKSESHR